MTNKFHLFDDNEGFGADIRGEPLDLSMLLVKVMSKHENIAMIIAVAMDVHEKMNGKVDIPSVIIKTITDDQLTAQIRISIDNLQDKIRVQNKSMAGKVDELVELIKSLTGRV